ncbi:hypothetical protein AB1Y20_023428 [Prymnesium parvum]|uniref:anthranilate phosphoribosyltransferase n=1 Tax=Prymnesium parvum TaxID=97485 RepID=A0AB34JEF8_PRYPA
MSASCMKPLLETLLSGASLTAEQAADGVERIIAGADACQAAAFLVLLKAKGESPQEVAGMVTAMRRHMVRVHAGVSTIDIVGTGGDGHHTVNVSSGAAVVMAACGAKVAKHGNRSVSSQCGSADVLEELGVRLDLSAAAVERCVQQAGIAFMYAPAFHPAMKSIVPIRKALGVRTIFNILGPLLNPAECSRQLIGVYSEPMVELMANVLHELRVEHALVVHCGGLDELAPIAVAHVAWVTRDGVTLGSLDPFALGFRKCSIDDLKGGDRVVNAKILKQVLGGELTGPVADTIILNAGAALFVNGTAASIAEGCDMARGAIENGAAMRTLHAWVDCCKEATA